MCNLYLRYFVFLSDLYLLTFMQTVFLPQGYPETVSQDYLAYQIWDTVQVIILIFLMNLIMNMVKISKTFYITFNDFIALCFKYLCYCLCNSVFIVRCS